MTTSVIVHHQNEQCFVLERQGQQARLEYQLQPAGSALRAQVNFNHTYVPPELRGQGLAEQLVQFGLHWAAQQNMHVVASCWYVAKVIRAKAEITEENTNQHNQG